MILLNVFYPIVHVRYKVHTVFIEKQKEPDYGKVQKQETETEKVHPYKSAMTFFSFSSLSPSAFCSSRAHSKALCV